jgi:hypothetical protein
VNGSPRAFELRRVSFGIPFWETFRAAMNARKSSGFLWKGCKAMREVARVYLSSNGKEFLIYDGNDNLVSVTAVNRLDFEEFGIDVADAIDHTAGE